MKFRVLQTLKFIRPGCSLLSALGLLLGLLSCSAPQHPKDIERIDSLRTQTEQLLKTQSLMGWNSWAFGAPSNQDSLYKANAGLFTLQNITLVKETGKQEPDSVQKKRLRYLERYLAGEYISKQVAPLTDQVSNVEATSTVLVEGKQVPYRQVASLMASEKKQSGRAALYTATDPVYFTDQYTGSDTIGVADLAYAPDACAELTFVDFSGDGVAPDANSGGIGPQGAAAAPAAPAAPAEAEPAAWWEFWKWFD